MKTQKLIVLSATLVVTNVFAQANFEGLSGGVNLIMANASADMTISSTTFKQGDTSQLGSLEVSYGIPLDTKSVMTFGGTYGMGDMKAGSVTSSGTGYDLKGTDIYSMYLAPGYLVSNTTLAYGKLAYTAMKGSITLTTGTSASADFKGWGYGAGIRTMLNEKTYLQVEFTQTKFDAVTNSFTTKPSATMGSVGIGMKF
jgi:hypothetical protein